MKKNCFALIVSFACVCGYGDAVSDVRLALDHVTSKLDSRRNLAGMYLNYGILCSTNSEYRALAVAVSNQWRTVLGDLSRCATNQLERLLVLGVRDRFDENFFYDYVEGVFDQWQTGMVSTVEFQWVRHSDRPGFDCLFERRYKVERVRRLIQRFKQAETNNVHWQKVLSGEAYTNYLEEVSAGMWR